MEAVKVTVLIVNWNGKHLLGPCLGALQQQTYPAHQIIVVDNGSSDGSLDFLRTLDIPQLQLLPLKHNTGFSGGNNAAWPVINGEILALLNNDTQVDPAWIAEAVPLFQDPEIGMVACKSLRLEDPGTLDKAGHLIYPDGLNRGRGTGLPDGPPFDTVAEVLWPDGGAGFYRRTMLDDIGFFDDAFFLYGEDAELGLRARWAGYRCLYQPASRLLHHHSATLGRGASQKIYYIERNRVRVLFKTFPWSWIWVSPFFTLLRYVMNLVSLLRGRGAAASFQRQTGSWSLIWALSRALRDGILGIPASIKARKTVKRRVSSRAFRSLLRRHCISAREITLQD